MNERLCAAIELILSIGSDDDEKADCYDDGDALEDIHQCIEQHKSGRDPLQYAKAVRQRIYS